MKSFFIEIAAVSCAAKLTNTALYDNYAVFGAMGRYRDTELGDIRNTEGIDDVAEKAESFRFGARCGKALEQYIGGFDDSKIKICEAQAARVFFAPMAGSAQYSAQELESTLLTVMAALVKRAQIRTHTTKPGYEDINTWLARYFAMQRDYLKALPEFVHAVVCPTAEELKLAEEFLSGNDAIVALAMQKEPVGEDALAQALSETPVSAFGKYLRDFADTVRS